MFVLVSPPELLQTISHYRSRGIAVLGPSMKEVGAMAFCLVAVLLLLLRPTKSQNCKAYPLRAPKPHPPEEAPEPYS